MNYVREVAHRIFAAEFNESTLEIREGDDQYAPKYLITPTGAKCNRVFVVGTLTEKKDVGTDVQFWRGRIVDPTGAFTVYAGQYQPEAADILAKTSPYEFIAVVGKPSIYTTKNGNIITSIKPEYVQVVDADIRDRWVVDTAKQTKVRIDKLKGAEPDVVMAREYYLSNIKKYNSMVINALNKLKSIDYYIKHEFEVLKIESEAEILRKEYEALIDEYNVEMMEAIEDRKGDYDLWQYYCEDEKDPAI